MKAHLSRYALGGAALLSLLVFGGCRAEDRNRPLRFEPGVYQGERTPPLTKEQKRELQERSNLMR